MGRGRSLNYSEKGSTDTLPKTGTSYQGIVDNIELSKMAAVNYVRNQKELESQKN